MKIISNGNFSPWLRIALWASGIAIVALSYQFLPGMLMFFGIVLGMVILALGTYSERASLLNIKPFDSNSYKKVRDSYKVKDDEADKSK
jgi:hypothetical protein